MPFTLSHPAAVLPLRRYCQDWLNFTALVIGSMTPDFGYYVNAWYVATVAHTFLGSFTICLPTGAAALMLVYLFRKPVCFLLPSPHRPALNQFFLKPFSFGAKNSAVTALCLLVGAWTHILWDSFTHDTGWFVQRLPVLRAQVFQINSAKIPLYYLLQQFSTVAGGAVILIAYICWLRRQQKCSLPTSDVDGRRYLLWVAIALVSLSVVIEPALRVARLFSGFLAFRVFCFRVGVYGIAVAIPVTLIISVVIYVIAVGRSDSN